MPRGISSVTGLPNFLVKRYVCPSCLRKGLYAVWYSSFHGGNKQQWVCMYSNCISRKDGTMFKEKTDPAVLQLNPSLNIQQ